MNIKILFLLMIVSLSPIQNAVGETSLDSDQEFKKAKSELQKSTADFNYLEFRRLYAKTKSYKPYTGGELQIKQKANESINNKDYSQCVTYVDKWLNINYTSIEAHFDKYICCKELNDNDCASLHKTIVDGLLDSIIKSSDGKTPETAYETFNTDEIYFFLYANGLKPNKQRLLNKNGKVYDVMDAENPKSGNTYTIYFDITVQMTNKNDNI